MNPESVMKESSPSDWLELANGGGVMFRDSTSSQQSEAQNYVSQRRLKRLSISDAAARLDWR